MPSASRAMGDDADKLLQVTDYSAGMVTYLGALALPQNAFSQNTWNVVPFPGRLKYRGGYSKYSALDGTADQAVTFYDSDHERHFAVWRDGDLVDVAAGTETVIESGVYTPGQRVGCVALNGILYWSAIGVPLRYWDPVAGTFGAVTQTGPQDMTGSPYLFLYTNAIVALGVQYDAAAYQPTVMGWSNVNDPTYWDASNAQAVGPLNEATLQFGLVFGIANTGVPPTRTFIVGRSDGAGIFSYTGALGTLQENVINCPVGCLDGASAAFIPGADAFGLVVFMGTDYQFWSTNGINANPISMAILDFVTAEATAAQKAGARFWAGYNEKFAYYFCNVSDKQFVYKWDLKAWSAFIGVPNGPILTGEAATDANGFPSIFIASNDQYLKGFWRFGLAGIGDRADDVNEGGTPPQIVYKSPFLHAGNPELNKIWKWLALYGYNVGTRYRVSVRGMSRANDGTYMETDELIFNTASAADANAFQLDVSLLDGPAVLVGQGNSTTGGQVSPVVMHGRLACPFVPEDDSILRGLTGFTETLKSNAVQVTVEYYDGPLDFDILGLQLRYLERGYRFEGGNEYDSEMGVPPNNDPFVPPLSPVDYEQDAS